MLESIVISSSENDLSLAEITQKYNQTPNTTNESFSLVYKSIKYLGYSFLKRNTINQKADEAKESYSEDP